MPRSRRLAFTTSCAAADALIGGSILRPRAGKHIAHESTHSFGDVLPTLALCTEGGDSFNKRLTSQTENVPSSVDVPIMNRAASRPLVLHAEAEGAQLCLVPRAHIVLFS
jgi:hypothetical protein